MIYKCKECGSQNVEQLAWIDLNTEEILDGTGNYGIEYNWCRDCKAHVEIKLIMEKDE